MRWLREHPPRPQSWGSRSAGTSSRRSPQDWGRGGILLLLLAVGPCSAAPPAPAPPATAPAVPASVPDYGGRDAPGLLSGAGADAPDPAAQAGRSLLALALVLGGVYGGVRLLKRGGYTGGPVGAALLSGLGRSLPVPPQQGATAGARDVSTPGSLRLLQSQPLPGGGAVHLLSVQERTLVLVGATAQGVSLITEWDAQTEEAAAADEASPAQPPAFQEYLARVEAPPIPPRAPERVPAERLSDLLSTQRARSREDTRE